MRIGSSRVGSVVLRWNASTFGFESAGAWAFARVEVKSDAVRRTLVSMLVMNGNRCLYIHFNSIFGISDERE